jgi:hypothetical protein
MLAMNDPNLDKLVARFGEVVRGRACGPAFVGLVAAG